MATTPARRLAANAATGAAGNGGSPRTFETIQNARCTRGPGHTRWFGKLGTTLK